MAPRHTTEPPREPGRLGRTAVVGGGLLVLLAHLFAWYPTGSDATPGGGFADLRRSASQFSDATVAAPYFGWLSWSTLAVAVALGLAAARPTRATDGLRLAGFVAGVVGIVVTYYALAQLLHVSTGAGGGLGTVLGPACAGVWGTLAGFALIAAGAAIGPAHGPSDTIRR